MANWLTSFLRKGAQLILRMKGVPPQVTRTILDIAQGKPPSETFIRGLVRRFGVDIARIEEALRRWQRGEIPEETVAEITKGITGDITEVITPEMVGAVPIKEAVRIPHESITGRDWHYVVEMIGEEVRVLPDGTTVREVESRWVTVTSDQPLTKAQVLGRAHEMLEPDWRVEGTAFRGAFAGFGAIQTRLYGIEGPEFAEG